MGILGHGRRVNPEPGRNQWQHSPYRKSRDSLLKPTETPLRSSRIWKQKHAGKLQNCQGDSLPSNPFLERQGRSAELTQPLPPHFKRRIWIMLRLFCRHTDTLIRTAGGCLYTECLNCGRESAGIETGKPFAYDPEVYARLEHTARAGCATVGVE